MDESPLKRVVREKESEAIEVDGNTLEFLSPDRNSVSKLIVDRRIPELRIETILHHGARLIEQNLYLLSNTLSGKFTEDQIHDIIEDISARLRHMELPATLETVPYGFKIIDQDEEGTKFGYSIPYENPEFESYEALRTKVDTILMQSFELVYDYLVKITLFLEMELSRFLIEPTEIKLLEIRKLLFRAKFYRAMSGRFANEQQRIAQSMRKEALALMEQFQKDYPDLAAEKLQPIRAFFQV